MVRIIWEKKRGSTALPKRHQRHRLRDALPAVPCIADVLVELPTGAVISHLAGGLGHWEDVGSQKSYK